MSSGDNLPTEAPLEGARFLQAQRCTWISAGVNVLLTIVQVAIGILANAQSLVADGLHSLSDLVADGLVLVANRKGAHPADSDHPYGHGRYETAASLALGILLAATGAGMLVAAGSRLQDVANLPPVHPIAFWTALVTLAAKEGLFRYMLAVAEKLRSPMLIANAWHARSDAASSLVVAVGIGGSLLGYKFFDSLAAALVGFLILRMGLQFTWEALQELIDTGLSAEEVAAIRQTVVATPGVVGVHDLRTRRMGHQGLVDVHVRVDSHISVSEGHRIAEAARRAVVDAHQEVLDVLVHVDVEDDILWPQGKTMPPDRDKVLERLMVLLGDGVPAPEKVVLHYLGWKVEAEVFLPPEFCADGPRLAALEQRIAAGLVGDPYISAIALQRRAAPK